MIADDLTYRAINALNNHEIRTPNLNRLARSGCSFTHCFHQGSWNPAVCIASRTMLNTGVSCFRAPFVMDEVPTWGQTLGRAGYETYIVGKWHLDETTLQRSFQEIGPIARGMFNSTLSAYLRPSPHNTWTPWDRSLKGHWLHTDLWLNERPGRIDHSSNVWASRAIDRLGKPSKRGAPFFLYLGFSAPHDPRQCPKEFVDLYPPHSIEIPPNYLPVHPFDQGDGTVRDELLAPFPRTKEAVRLHRSEYYGIITHMDSQIGLVLDALERSGKADNTYVILTADHGLAVGQHGLMGKQNLYDHSVRMPLLISGPGVPRGKRVDEMVYQHSMFATTCELAGVPVPRTVEFPSLAGLLRGEGTRSYDAIFSYYRNYQRSVRTRTHKLILYPHISKTQLFDLVKDPWETNDLAEMPEHAGLRKELTRRLQQFREELGDGRYHWDVPEPPPMRALGPL
jgi:choline-sulfatase